MKKSLWQSNQQVESSLRHLVEHVESLKALDPPAPPGLVEDCEMAVHHLKNALVTFKKERDRRKKLAEEFHKRLRQPD